MTADIFKPIDLPRDALGLMKFPPEIASAIDMLIRTAQQDKRWETCQDIEISLKSPEFWAYWIYKTMHPITRAMKGRGVEEQLLPHQRTHFDLLPEGFVVDSELTLSTSGDLMCTRDLESAKDRLYEEVAELVFGADIAYANLESTLTTGDIVPLVVGSDETPRINISPAQYKALVSHRDRQFDIVHLANNHILDCGEEGVSTTLKRLKADGIAQVGVNETIEDATRVTVTELNNLRIGWVAHTFSVNFKPFPADKPWIINMTPFHLDAAPDLTAILAQIKACRADGCDLVIVSLHWGLEFEFYPHPDQLKWAHLFAEAGADAVIGHHPHVIQPVEIYRPLGGMPRAVPIIYSLGNLTPVFSHPATVMSLVARLRLVKGRVGTERRAMVATLNLTPVALVAQRDGVQDVPKLTPVSNLLHRSQDPQMLEYIIQMAAYADLVLGPTWRVGAPFDG